MKAFFRFFGSKVKLAKEYGPPRHKIVIEPFAGAAGYSCYWDVKKAILIEKDPMIYGIWDWLINIATYDDIMALDGNVTNLNDCNYCQPAKDMIGFWYSRGGAHPISRISENNLSNVKYSNSKTYWCNGLRDRIANNLYKIKNWEIIHGSYDDAPDIEAHWHIDPPYQHQGIHYNYNNKKIDFEKLGEWCLSRKGTGEVCEASPADWLPFDHLKSIINQRNSDYSEVIYRLDDPMNVRLFQ